MEHPDRRGLARTGVIVRRSRNSARSGESPRRVRTLHFAWKARV